MRRFTYGVLFSGLGGLSRGLLDAGLDQAFAVDVDEAACRDHARICGERATVADLATMTPAELRALSPHRPDVLVSSPPCVAFSGCLPHAQSVTPEYKAISSLAFRGIWLALEAWSDNPPPLILIENVPRILSRGRLCRTRQEVSEMSEQEAVTIEELEARVNRATQAVDEAERTGGESRRDWFERYATLCDQEGEAIRALRIAREMK